jgi:hypothetical protein
MNDERPYPMSTRWLLLFFGCFLLAVPVSVDAQGCEDPFGCEEHQPEPCDPWLNNCPSGGCNSCSECSIDYESPGYFFICQCNVGGDGYVNCSVSRGGATCENTDRCYYT